MLLQYFVMNLFALLLSVKRRKELAFAFLAVLGLYAILQWERTSDVVSSLALLAEGFLCSLAMVFAQQKTWRPSTFYLASIAPSVLFVAIVTILPSLRQALLSELATSKAVLDSSLPEASKAQANQLMQWVSWLFPGTWVLLSLSRIWLVRKIAGILFYRWGVPMQQARFWEFRLHDTFLWLFAGGLLLEIVSIGPSNLVGHNILLVTGTLYLIQGFAVLDEFLNKRGFSKLFVIGLYVLFFLTQFPLVLVALLGLLDIWVEFRKRFSSPVAPALKKGD